MELIDSKTTYSTLEFNRYAHAKGLNQAEKFLIEAHLDKAGKTLEAGTGGGRILLELKRLGFSSLYGFDFVPGMIEQAKKRDSTNSICFEVQDAVCLNYGASYFDQVIYLGQMICTIEEQEERLNTMREAYRVLKPGGHALFSFLSFEVRRKSARYFPYLVYLFLFRKFLRRSRTIQSLPWLRCGERFNFGALVDAAPYVYWYRVEEAYRLLRTVGFRIVAIGSSYQIARGRMHESYQTLLDEPIEGRLYVVATK